VNDAPSLTIATLSDENGAMPRSPCPKCAGKSGVTNTRPWHASVRRRRQCFSCDYRWTTIEIPADLGDRLPEMQEALKRLAREAEDMARQLATLLRHLP
jgi:hypothetical protein